ncbi:MAG: helix-turn-helix transcriptional regulator [Thermoguttaceae bacterium]
MSIEHPNSDSDLMDLLRIAGPLSVAQLADAMEVTPTAIRQRLIRLTYKTMIQREAVRAGRGRPKHRYWLTEKGVMSTGSNFTDLALALWNEVSQMQDEKRRREMLRRIARTLAQGYAEKIQGTTAAERIRSLGELLAQRRIPVSVENSGNKSSLTEHACPYPTLAESDRSVCTMEKMLFSELLGGEVELTRCRLDGGDACQFQTS